MEIIVKEDRYVIKLGETENVKILIDDAEKYNHTVATGKEATISFDLEERAPIIE